MKSNTLPSQLCALALCTLGSGCYDEILSAVVDRSDTSPGGAIATTLSGQALTTTTGLAKSSTTAPVEIDGRSKDSTMIISMVATDDSAGNVARTVLGIANSTITVPLLSTSDSLLQLHFLGSTCTATSGEIALTTDSNLLVTGTFTGEGTIGTSGTACSLSGTITAVPQSR